MATAVSSPASNWDELRREARRIEGDLDVRLSSYAKLGGYSDPRRPASDSHWKSMEMEIESLLARLTEVNEAMSRCAAAATPTTSVAQKLTRHRDILHEFTQEFKRTRGNIMSIREHAELLTSVRNDINEYKASSSMQPVPNLLRERAAIHGSVSQVKGLYSIMLTMQQVKMFYIFQIDEVTSQAEAIKGVLSAQRSTFGDIQGKVKQLSDKFPMVRSILGMIKRKKSKDTIILAAVIAGCTLFLFIYWISK
ncbi:Golgi SNAP receptor complex member 1-2-like isoform X2 [Canna indica]|uniref:Golgi SNAP receptor complex member 1-2-like isoform X2 n=1 Tax=Canna indica TaxID=4628 RepID=A0AAQ3JZ39_9LILI|nr:Golgi SNAP receptor complex member 1-2-like isoform X2 [Canna indica]